MRLGRLIDLSAKSRAKTTQFNKKFKTGEFQFGTERKITLISIGARGFCQLFNPMQAGVTFDPET
jgi:hypothetical protein